MKNLLILGAGTAGTIMASHLRHKLPRDNWKITLLDRATYHDYQPGYLFMPFGVYDEKDVRRPMKRVVPRGVDYRQVNVECIEAEANRVTLEDGTSLPYDILIVATATIAPNAPRESKTAAKSGKCQWRTNTDKTAIAAPSRISAMGKCTMAG